MTAELRKYAIGVVASHQYLTQVEPPVIDAVRAEHRASRTQKFQVRAEICSIGLMEFPDAFCQSANPAEPTRQVDGATGGYLLLARRLSGSTDTENGRSRPTKIGRST